MKDVFILIDVSDPEMLHILCGDDGYTFFFDTKKEAQQFAKKNLKFPTIITNIKPQEKEE